MAATVKHIDSDFESIYIRLRQKEGRIYTNEELARLPGINRAHLLYKEWKIREQSCERLINYLSKKNEPLDILEVGCGNGWLSARLATHTKGNVTGIDINSPELHQAQDVFKYIPNLYFVHGDIRNDILKGKKFNTIVFAASIQYFPALNQIIDCALHHLLPMGEIHILDSHFYKPQEIEEAKQRSLNHFRSVGYPDMAKLYYHHCMNDLEKYTYRILYNPRYFINKLMGKKNPFYHICITKKETIA